METLKEAMREGDTVKVCVTLDKSKTNKLLRSQSSDSHTHTHSHLTVTVCHFFVSHFLVTNIASSYFLIHSFSFIPFFPLTCWFYSFRTFYMSINCTYSPYILQNRHVAVKLSM